MDIFSKVPTKPKLLEVNFSTDVNKKLRVWMPAIFGEMGWGEGDGQERIQNGMHYLTMGLYKMQTVDCRLLFLGLEHNGSVVVTF